MPFVGLGPRKSSRMSSSLSESASTRKDAVKQPRKGSGMLTYSQRWSNDARIDVSSSGASPDPTSSAGQTKHEDMNHPGHSTAIGTARAAIAHGLSLTE